MWGSDFYGVERFLEGWSPLRPYEVAEAGDVTGLDLVHRQCHFGLDPLAWARLGAIVTALAAAGLRIESLVERPTLVMQRWPFQVEHGHQDWRNPPELPQIPLTFSLLAQKPVGS